MKTRYQVLFGALLAAEAVTFAGAALAQESHPASDTYVQPFVATRTRAQVVAELEQARRDGWVHASSYRYVDPFVPTLSRARVRAEAVEALRLGLLPGGEQTVFPTAEQIEQIRLAGLRAEQAQTAAAGTSASH